MSKQYDPDHHISFSFTDTWDTPVNLKASIVMEWCKYKEIAEQLQKRIDELESENKALRLIAGSHSMSELRRNQILAGDKWFKYPPAPERKEQ